MSAELTMLESVFVLMIWMLVLMGVAGAIGVALKAVELLYVWCAGDDPWDRFARWERRKMKGRIR